VPPVTDQLAALQTYLTVVEQYNLYLLPGDWNFSPSDAIPANMLLPWADFEAKYGVQDMKQIKGGRRQKSPVRKIGKRAWANSKGARDDAARVHRLLMKAVAEEYRAGKSELPFVTKLAAKDCEHQHRRQRERA
jgi:hypothetical protein